MGRNARSDSVVLEEVGQEFHLELARIKGQHVVLEFNDDLSQRVVGARAQVWHNRVSVNAVSKLLPEPGKRLLGLGNG